MNQFSVYLTFKGNCREAMTFYKKCLGGDLELQTVAGSPIEDQCPPEMKNNIMHSTLIKDGIQIMASDLIGPGGYIPGNTVALALNCKSEAEINTLYTALLAGGEVIDPLKVQFWGAMFGVVEDQFGIRWMLNFDQNQPQ